MVSKVKNEKQVKKKNNNKRLHHSDRRFEGHETYRERDAEAGTCRTQLTDRQHKIDDN
jgi:hypothetical protein